VVLYAVCVCRSESRLEQWALEDEERETARGLEMDALENEIQAKYIADAPKRKYVCTVSL